MEVNVILFFCLLIFASLVSGLDEDLSKDARYKCIVPHLVQPEELHYTDEELLHIGIIITNENRTFKEGATESALIQNLGRLLPTILESSTGSPLHFVIISDSISIKNVTKKIRNVLGKQLSEKLLLNNYLTLEEKIKAITIPQRFCVEFVDLDAFSNKHRSDIDAMKEDYCRIRMKDIVMKGENNAALQINFEKYCLDLFFIAPFYYNVLPESLKRILVIDIDLSIQTDLSDLYRHFDEMTPNQLIGVANDQVGHYAGLYKHNKKKTWLKIRDQVKAGLNTGVVLYDLEKQRQHEMYKAQLNPEVFHSLAMKYEMKGSVGDQDWMTVMAFEFPDIFYLLPCEFNSQIHPIDGTRCLTKPKIVHHHGSI